MKSELQGIMPAIVSPCDEQDRFLEEEFAVVAGALYKDGVHGLYVCGVTGEAYSMRLQERKRAAEIAVEIAKANNGSTLVHVGAFSTRDAVELAAHAALAGANAVSSMPPPNYSHTQLKSYYTDISRAAQIPVLVYHIPAWTHQSPNLQQMIELLDIPGVVGLKFSDANLFFLKRLLFSRPDIVAFNGNDELLCPGLLYGAHGGIGMTYNVFPKLFVRMYRLIRDGDIAGAMKLQDKLNRFVDVLVHHGSWTTLEAALEVRGLPARCARHPRLELAEDARNRLKSELQSVLSRLTDGDEAGTIVGKRMSFCILRNEHGTQR